MEDFRKDIDDYFCRFTFGQFVTLILLEVVTLFFVFYLGARYGSDLLGTGDAKRQAIVLPQNSQNPKTVNDIVGAPPVDYTYPEVLTSRDGQKAVRIKPSGVTADEYDRQKIEDPEAIVRRDMPKEGTTTPENPVGAEVIKKSGMSPTASSPESTKVESPEIKVETPIKDPVVQTPKPKGKFAIQVGSYQSSDEASAALSGWKKKGYSAYTAVGNVPQKGTWYRVRIGGFPSREEAQKFLDKFKAKEKTPALVVLSSS